MGLAALATLLAGCDPLASAPPIGPPGTAPSDAPAPAASAPGPGAGTPRPATPTPATPGVGPTPTAAPAGTPTPPPAAPGERATADRPDDEPGMSVHLVYVLPADGTDAGADTDGSVAAAVERMETWMARQTGGPKLRFDRADGMPDVSFHRTGRTKAQLAGTDGNVLERLVPELVDAGFDHPQKIYGVYYAGPGKGTTLGQGGKDGYGAVYLDQTRGGFGASPGPSGMTEVDATLMHELLHALGHIDPCAPHHGDLAENAREAHAGGHVVDDEHDILYPKSPLGLITLDDGRDDYYGHGKPGCWDLARSPFLTPLAADALPHYGRPLALDAGPGAAEAGPATRLTLDDALAAAEGEARQVMAAAWPASAGPFPPLDEGVRDAARRVARGLATADATPIATQRARAGFLGAGAVQAAGSVGPADTPLAELMASFTPKLREMATKLAAGDGPATGMAVGMYLADGKFGVSAAVARATFEVRRLRMGAGPLGTYTLTGEARLRPGAKAARGSVHVDDDLAYVFRVPGPDWLPFAASLPRGGSHRLALGVADGSAFSIDTQLGTVDTRLAPDAALRAIFGGP